MLPPDPPPPPPPPPAPPPPPLQSYCLKVKELDDEEYEAAVSYMFRPPTLTVQTDPAVALPL